MLIGRQEFRKNFMGSSICLPTAHQFRKEDRMKYRELTPTEIEAYNIGYKVGARQIVITDIEWENETEHKIYRKGYLAGCKDRHRNNVNNVNNVKTETMSNLEQCQNRDSDNDTDIDTDIVIEEKNKGGVGEKGKTNETTQFHVECQNFDEIPPHILPVMKKYWTDAKIESIRKDLAFMSSHDTSVAILLTKYDSDLLKQEPPKQNKKFIPPTETEWMDFCGQLNLDPKRMKSQFYAYQENNWKDSHGNTIKNWKMKIRQVWDKPENKDPDADVPKGPKIADMSNFVRAKPLGEEE